MKIVFVDSLYWIALINPKDQWHSVTVEAKKRYGSAKFVTTEAVLIEVLNYFSTYGARFRFISSQVTRAILDDPDIEVLPINSSLFLSGLNLDEQTLDKGYSMVDCISMMAMKNRDISEVLTHDKHFSQEGFNILL
ncbi:MAG: PIN domain-containing protein [Microcystis aeruginosa Ma_QC_C_20070703_M131]|uniref:PIN domain-containing protein n=1 Tax=Microcystis aeruginosa Ma_QC_C_20070703_M131 TaxID=2486263 RepID=A0A551Y1T3_MICAE|nr:MAG: PIN domain-containing protein [Microcystis aeruginosa Ma_QC_C_20070703_M131]